MAQFLCYYFFLISEYSDRLIRNLLNSSTYNKIWWCNRQFLVRYAMSQRNSVQVLLNLFVLFSSPRFICGRQQDCNEFFCGKNRNQVTKDKWWCLATFEVFRLGSSSLWFILFENNCQFRRRMAVQDMLKFLSKWQENILWARNRTKNSPARTWRVSEVKLG